MKAAGPESAGLIVVGTLQFVERLAGIEKSSATTWHNTFLHRCAGGMERMVDAVLRSRAASPPPIAL
jgi:hypothetical protein